MSRLDTLLSASRPFSWVNTAFPFAAAYLFAGGTPSWPLIVGIIFFLFPFNLLMYGVNDVYDYESDIRNPRKGGVEGAKIPKPLHRFVLIAAGLICLPFTLYLGFISSMVALTMLIILLIDTVAYSAPPLRLKERPVLDSISSSLHFTGPAVFGMLLAGYNPALIPGLMSLFIWGLASHAFGAIQDIEPDKKAGIASIATVFGATATSWLCIGLFAIAAIAPLAYGLAGVIMAVVLTAYPMNVWLAHRQRQYNRGWRRWMKLNLLVGFIFTQLALWL